MIRRFAAILAVVFAAGSASVMACPGDKGKTIDGKTGSGQMSTLKTST